MNMIFETQKTIRVADADVEERWRQDAIFVEMQETASMHDLGTDRDYSALREKGLAWILSRVEVNMQRYPKIGETARIITWPGVERMGICPRYFDFYVGEEKVGHASTIWALMDISQRKMITPKDACVRMDYDADAPKYPFPRSIKHMNDAEKRSVSYIPKYTDIDSNGHFNNTRYVAFVTDQFDVEKHRKMDIENISINYSKEIVAGENISVDIYERDNANTVFGYSGEKLCFAAEIIWREKAQ